MRMPKYIFFFMLCFLTISCERETFACRTNTTNFPSRDNGVCRIENPAVQFFMSASDASFSDKASCITQAFFDDSLSYRPDQPVGKTISFYDAKAKEVKVCLTEKDNALTEVFSTTVSLTNGKGQCTFINLIPSKTYRYTVKSGERTISSGTFSTEGQLRMIAIDGGFNIRDLGGWKGLDGHRVKYAWIYRGGSLGGTDKDGQRSDITPEGKAELMRLGIAAQLDLRAATNAGKYIEEGSLHSYSAGEAPLSTMDFNNTMTDYGAYNQDMSVVSDVAWIIYELKRGRPVYFNCRQGADRTGTVAFLLEGLLGCYEYTNAAGGNQMALDYELTGFSQANRIDNWKVATSCRPASEAYTNKEKLFRQILDLEAAEEDIHLTTVQQKCYYYLNRYTNSQWKDTPLHIDRADLDWFIVNMLQGMSAETYAPHRPQWATEGNNLQEVAEKCANVVHYANSAE